MRVLVVSTGYPFPAGDGLELQLRGVMTALRERGHHVVLVCATSEDEVLPAVDSTQDELVTVPRPGGRAHRLRVEALALPARRSILVQQVTSSPLGGAVRAAVRDHRPDVVHLCPGWLAELAADLDVPTVLIPLDASGPNWTARAAAAHGLRRYLALRERSRTQRLEREVYPRVDAVVVVTEHDAELLKADGLERVHVVTNGVDLDQWARPDDAPEREEGLVVLSGAMSYVPNVSAAEHLVRDVLPRLQERVPHAHVRLVGRDPSPAVLALAGPDVEVTGTVPDLAPHLWAAAAYACPMISGSGVKNKLMEALAASCACVATPLATAGLDLEHGRHLLVADSADGLAVALATVLQDPTVAATLQEGAREHAARLSWQRAAEGFEGVYSAAIAHRQAQEAGMR